MPEQHPTRQWVIDTLKEKWNPASAIEAIPLEAAANRILARDYHALYNQPVYRASAMDGVAVDAARFANGIPNTSSWQLGTDCIRADTGDDFDDAYDAVIPIERISFPENGGIRIDDAPGGPGSGPGPSEPFEVHPGLNVRPAGASIPKGELLARTGTKLRPWDLAALAAGGITHPEVRKRPVVAFIPTGSELIPANQAPTRGQTLDSNTVLVREMLRELGAEPLSFPIVRDDPAKLKATLEEALAQADFVLINAGSSKGGEDFNATLLEQMGEVLCHWIAAAPGRPLCAAIVAGKPVINIPGPPLATYYVMDWCTRALVAHALGSVPEQNPTVTATLATKLGAPPFMEILARLDVEKTEEGFVATPIAMRENSMPKLLTAPAQFVTELGRKGGYQQGEQVTIELLRNEVTL